MRKETMMSSASRRNRWRLASYRRPLLLAAVLSCGFSAVGCGAESGVWEPCEETLTCTPVVACNADHGIHGRPVDCAGVYVTVDGDDDDPGTRDFPVATFARAFDLARNQGMRVYACADIFEIAVRVPAGMEVWGGLDCRDPRGHWPLHPLGQLTTIAPGPHQIPLTVVDQAAAPGSEGAAATTITRMRLVAQDATMPGESSIAMRALSGVKVEVRSSEIVAGNGADGAAGADGGIRPAQEGAPGNPGLTACSADTVNGGQRVTTSCVDGVSSGGMGGIGTGSDGGDGESGSPLPVTNPMNHGLGGTGQGALSCTEGRGGLAGDDGANGNGASGPGRLTDTGLEGVAGEDGQAGQHGYGGGGGGGSRGGSTFCGAGAAQGGASGGSGGAGGCGGKPGKGGGPGGSSIGILSYHASVRVSKTSITTGRGGDGGRGGNGQYGGVGGYGGPGGVNKAGSQPGCRGGDGGKGGNGGRGGGGHGGHSLAVAHTADLGPNIEPDSPVKFGVPGDGGGAGDLNANPGKPGSAAVSMGFQD